MIIPSGFRSACSAFLVLATLLVDVCPGSVSRNVLYQPDVLPANDCIPDKDEDDASDGESWSKDSADEGPCPPGSTGQQPTNAP